MAWRTKTEADADIFRLALDVAQTRARQVVYIATTPMFIQIAEAWPQCAMA
jgi:hypothetical protein